MNPEISKTRHTLPENEELAPQKDNWKTSLSFANGPVSGDMLICGYVYTFGEDWSLV